MSEKRMAVISLRCPESDVEDIDNLAERCGKSRSEYMAKLTHRHIRAQRLLGKHGLFPCDTYPRLLREQLRICDESGTVDEPEVRSLLIPKQIDAGYRLIHGKGSLDGKEAA